jgi:integrase
MSSYALTLTGREALKAAGQMANEYADGDLFNDFNGRKSDNTLRAYRADLGSFAAFLGEATGGAVGVAAGALQTKPEAWEGVTWGLVAAFQQWLLTHGDSTGTINRKISTVKVYAKLAAEAGILDGVDAAKIGSRVHGYTGKAARNVDSERKAAGLPTRSGPKKAAHVLLTAAQVRALKEQPDTPQGRRDGLLMALLLDHGLRVGELALLAVEAFGSDETGVLMSFYRPKVDKWQAHRLTDDTKRALNAYLGSDAPESGPLFRGSVKGGVLTVGASGITERNLSGRVCTLGQRIGINGLSAHDCRHSWATRAVAAGTDAFALRDAGGWASLAMPSRYVAAAAVVNERVRLAE